jgi:predicted phosphodiesterase
VNNRQLAHVAAIYDIHGNLPALEAVLLEIRAADVDHVVVGGDVVPGPLAHETIACLAGLEHPVSYLKGNGEVAVLEQLAGTFTEALPLQARASIRATAQALTPQDAAILESWPMSITLAIEGIGDVLFCHGTPRHHNEIFTIVTAEDALLPVFDPIGVSLVVCGHTHMPFDRPIGRMRVVNAGSVGLPFGNPGADWLLLGQGIELRHTDYDLEAAATQIRQSGFADAEGFARQVLQPTPAAPMLEVFGRAELRYGR